VPQGVPSTGALIAAVIQSGITADNVDVIERLCALKEREEARDAAREFADSFSQLQTETPKIVACKAVPDNSGNVRYSYAPYEDIMKAVRPLLAKYGFSISYDQDILEGRVIVTCKLKHKAGHSESNKFACRIGSGPPKASEAQGDGAATTYAKRFALCAALGITIERDDSDGRDGGDTSTITEKQAADFRLRCEAVGIVPAKFLKWLQADRFEDIRAKDYDMANAEIAKRENFK
jgi:hypothetical protein